MNRQPKLHLLAFSFPEFLYPIDEFHPDPTWQKWWEETLKYKPEALFESQPSLIEWNDPAIVNLVNAKQVKSRPMSAFGRCVNAVLDAFLRLLGVSNGLKEIESRKTPLPKIRCLSVSSAKQEISDHELAEFLKALQRRAKKL